MKIIVWMITALFVLSAYGSEPMLQATPYKVLQQALGKEKPHFVEFGSDICHSCQIMGKTLYRMKQKYSTCNIEFVNVRKEREAARSFGIQMIPTQLIFDGKGKEAYRHIGLLEAQEIENLLVQYKLKTNNKKRK